MGKMYIDPRWLYTIARFARWGRWSYGEGPDHLAPSWWIDWISSSYAHEIESTEMECIHICIMEGQWTKR